MRVLLLLILFQYHPLQPPTNQSPIPQLPPIFTQKPPTTNVPIIKELESKTTPHLNSESDLMAHYVMGLDIGGQREKVADLNAKVEALQEKRDKLDRPDIDDLKKSRDHIEWTWDILTAVVVTGASIFLGIFGFFRLIIWDDTIKPRLKKALST